MLKNDTALASGAYSDGGGISVGLYPPNQSTLPIFMWLLVVFLFDPGQIRYRASVRLSSCFFYLLTHHNLYPQNEIPGYAPVWLAISSTLIDQF